MDLVLYIGPKCGQGGGGPKTLKFCGRHISIVPKARYSLARLVDDLLQEVWKLLHDGHRLPRREADAVHRRRRVVRRLAQPRRRPVLRVVALRVAVHTAAAIVVATAVHFAIGLCHRRLRPLLDLRGGRLGRLRLRLLHCRSLSLLLLLLPLVGVDLLLIVRILVVLVPAGVLVPAAVIVAHGG